jgi:uncharacterized membrane protein YgcG
MAWEGDLANGISRAPVCSTTAPVITVLKAELERSSPPSVHALPIPISTIVAKSFIPPIATTTNTIINATAISMTTTTTTTTTSTTTSTTTTATATADTNIKFEDSGIAGNGNGYDGAVKSNNYSNSSSSSSSSSSKTISNSSSNNNGSIGNGRAADAWLRKLQSGEEEQVDTRTYNI